MFKIRRGDIIQVTKGRDKGKKGKVLKIFAQEKRALVEGVNLLKKHKRQTRQDQQGGIVSIESPIGIANIAFLCKHCNRASRVGFVIGKDHAKNRFCKACKEPV